jgi:hypothetical protein
MKNEKWPSTTSASSVTAKGTALDFCLVVEALSCLESLQCLGVYFSSDKSMLSSLSQFALICKVCFLEISLSGCRFFQ